MIKIPYIKIQQRDEVFFLTKMNFAELKNKINFHFRQPYSDLPEINIGFEEYLKRVKNKGLEISANPEGIQRRLQLSKIESIKKYLRDNYDSFFPNTVILSIDLSHDEKFMENYGNIENNDFGVLELPETSEFTIVDGQHRLAGLFISSDDIQKNFDIPVVLLINITLSTCAKIFADVNGTQSTVNQSQIYDLQELIKDNNNSIEKELHTMCKQFNESKKSPLFQHIKMLGIGNGAISQAFFIDALRKAFKELDFNYKNMQGMYNSLFYYFAAFQRIFSNYWPVKEKWTNYNDFLLYSKKVLREDKSQLLKTNGFGAILYLFPEVYKSLSNHDYQSYYNKIIKLKSIDWCKDEILIGGTGEKTQKEMYRKLKSMIEEKE